MVAHLSIMGHILRNSLIHFVEGVREGGRARERMDFFAQEKGSVATKQLV